MYTFSLVAYDLEHDPPRICPVPKSVVETKPVETKPTEAVVKSTELDKPSELVNEVKHTSEPVKEVTEKEVDIKDNEGQEDKAPTKNEEKAESKTEEKA